VWLNQYTNPGNWQAHYRTTAPAIARQFPQLDVLFVGAGTTGTLMGCARYFREWHRPVRIVAVDSVGSVAFGGAPGRRMIPGLGAGIRPPLLDESYVDEVIRVEEADTIRACHRLARHGFLAGTGWAFDEIGVHDLSASSAAGFRGYLEQSGAGGRITVHDQPEQLIRSSDLVVFATVAGQPHGRAAHREAGLPGRHAG
jgi:cysteine synthase